MSPRVKASLKSRIVRCGLSKCQKKMDTSSGISRRVRSRNRILGMHRGIAMALTRRSIKKGQASFVVPGGAGRGRLTIHFHPNHNTPAQPDVGQPPYWNCYSISSYLIVPSAFARSRNLIPYQAGQSSLPQVAFHPNRRNLRDGDRRRCCAGSWPSRTTIG